MAARIFKHPVFNALAAYAASAFVLLQAADLFLPALLFPDWVFRFLVIIALIGAPITVLVTVLLTPKREVPVPRRWPRFRPRVALGMVAVFAGASALLAFVSVKPQPIGFEDRDWLVLADCVADDPALTAAATDALSFALRESRYANVYPRNHMNEAIQRMQRKTDAPITRDLAVELAQREGAAGVVTCDITEVANATLINTAILNPQTGEPAWSHSATVRDGSDLIATIEATARELRGALGESRAQLWREARGLARVTTHSLDALKLYTQGIREWTNGKYADAVQLYHSAVQIDSQFARANAALGYYYYWTGDRTRGEFYMERAQRFAALVTERERLFLNAYVESGRNNTFGAISGYRSHLALYPDDRDAWYNLGTNLMMAGRCGEAIPAFEEALRLDSLYSGAEINLGTCHSRELQHHKALYHLERVRTRHPDWFLAGNLNHELGAMNVAAGQPERAREIFVARTRQPGGEAAGGHRSLGLLEAYSGRYRAAARELEEAVQMTRVANAYLSELRNRLFLATVHRRLGDFDAAKMQLARVSEIVQQHQIEPWWLLTVARVQLSLGETAAATALLQKMRAIARASINDDMVSIAILEGELLTRSGRPAEAIDRLELAHRRRADSYTRDALAHAQLAARNTVRARELFELTVREGGLLWEAQEPWFDAYLRLGRLAEERADTTAALAHYTQLLELWRNADAAFPDLVSVRSRVAALGGMDRQ